MWLDWLFLFFKSAKFSSLYKAVSYLEILLGFFFGVFFRWTCLTSLTGGLTSYCCFFLWLIRSYGLVLSIEGGRRSASTRPNWSNRLRRSSTSLASSLTLLFYYSGVFLGSILDSAIWLIEELNLGIRSGVSNLRISFLMPIKSSFESAKIFWRFWFFYFLDML